MKKARRDLAILMAFAAAPAMAAPEAMGLREALKYADERAPAIRVARQDLEAAKAVEVTARSALLPSLSLASSHGLSKTTHPDTGPWASSASLALTEVFYDNHESITLLATAGLERRAAELELAQARERLAKDLVDSFAQLSLSRLLLVVEREQAKLLGTQYAQMERQYRQGLKTRQDFLRFRGERLRSELSLREAETAIERAVRSLRERIGAEPGGDLAFASLPVAARPREVPTAAPDARKGPAYRATELLAEAGRRTADQVGRSVWPRVSLTGAASYGSSGYLGTGATFADGAGFSTSLLLGLNWTIFDWGGAPARATAAEARFLSLEATLEARRLALLREAERIGLDLRQLKTSLETSRELMEMERQSFELLEENYRKGLNTYLELITALGNLSKAKTGYYTAYFELERNRAASEAAEGRLYAELMAGE